MSNPTLVFDIETIPDLEGARRILGIESTDENVIWNAMRT